MNSPVVSNRVLAAGAICLIVVMAVLPFIVVLWLSVCSQSPGTGDAGASLPAWSNYSRALQDSYFRGAMFNTILFSLVGATFQLVLGTTVALAIARIPGSRLIFVAVILPCLVSPAAVGGLFRLILHGEYGPLAAAMRQLGLLGSTGSLLGDPFFATISTILVDTWQWTPFVAALLAIALRSIPSSVLLAASCDGASPSRATFRVVLPIILPMIGVLAVIRFLDATREFEKTLLLTHGGPASSTESIAIFTARVAFERGDVGLAAAVSVLTYAGIATLLWILMLRFRGWHA